MSGDEQEVLRSCLTIFVAEEICFSDSMWCFRLFHVAK